MASLVVVVVIFIVVGVVLVVASLADATQHLHCQRHGSRHLRPMTPINVVTRSKEG